TACGSSPAGRLATSSRSSSAPASLRLHSASSLSRARSRAKLRTSVCALSGSVKRLSSGPGRLVLIVFPFSKASRTGNRMEPGRSLTDSRSRSSRPGRFLGVRRLVGELGEVRHPIAVGGEYELRAHFRPKGLTANDHGGPDRGGALMK